MLPDARLTSVPLTSCAAVRWPNAGKTSLQLLRTALPAARAMERARLLAPRGLHRESDRNPLRRVDVGGNQAVALAPELGNRDVVPGVVRGAAERIMEWTLFRDYKHDYNSRTNFRERR